MAGHEQRGAERVPAMLRIRLRYPDVDTFVDKYAANFGRGGVFIASRTPKPVGSIIRFEFQLESGSPVVKGEGQVIWVKEFDPGQPQRAHGMGLKFTRLDAPSRAVLERVLAHKAQSRPRPAMAAGSGAAPRPEEDHAATPRDDAEKAPPPAPAASVPLAPEAATPTTTAAAIEDLEALAHEVGFSDEMLAHALERARAIAASADLELDVLSPTVPSS